MSESIQFQNKVTVAPKDYLLGFKFLSLEKLENQRFGLMVVFILLVGCLGGIAVGTGGLTQVFSLIILAFTTMTSLSMMLAVAPIKVILISSAIAIVADLGIITFNLIA